MSAKQNKKQGKKKAERKELQHLNEHLLKYRFPLEVQKLPMSKLNEHEQYLVKKVEDKTDVNDYTDEEITELKQLLGKYREEMNKINENDIVEGHKQFVEKIETEKEFLNWIDEIQDRELVMNMYLNGKYKQVTFHIKPVTDSRAVEAIEQHQDIYKDMTVDDRKLFQKKVRGDRLTQEEKDILEDLQQRIADNETEDLGNSVNNFLSYQVTPPDFNGDLHKREMFWAKFPFVQRMSLYLKVLDICGLSEEFDDKLFPNEQ